MLLIYLEYVEVVGQYAYAIACVNWTSDVFRDHELVSVLEIALDRFENVFLRIFEPLPPHVCYGLLFWLLLF